MWRCFGVSEMQIDASSTCDAGSELLYDVRETIVCLINGGVCTTEVIRECAYDFELTFDGSQHGGMHILECTMHDLVMLSSDGIRSMIRGEWGALFRSRGDDRPSSLDEDSAERHE